MHRCRFQMKLDRDANETHMELKSMRLKEAKEMQKLEMKNGMQSSPNPSHSHAIRMNIECEWFTSTTPHISVWQ